MMNVVLKQLACLSLLFLLIMSPLQTVHGSGRFSKFRTGFPSSSSSSNEFRGHGFHQRGQEKKDGEELFGDEKRRVHTGPNPLHNR